MLRTKQSLDEFCFLLNRANFLCLLLNKANRTLEVAPSLCDPQQVSSTWHYRAKSLTKINIDRNTQRRTLTHIDEWPLLSTEQWEKDYMPLRLLRHSSDPTKVTPSGTKKRLCLGVLKRQALVFPDKKERKLMDLANYDKVKRFCH